MIVVTHGGAGSHFRLSFRTLKAAHIAYDKLAAGAAAIKSCVEACRVLEDDPVFNAGYGSKIRIDGSIEMDAGVMDSTGNMGAVIAITGIKNPILAAYEVSKIPHIFLAGRGARQFARKCGLKSLNKTTKKAQRALKRAKKMLKERNLKGYYKIWNKHLSVLGCDTIGAVVLDRYGKFAAGNSTGGTTLMLKGRVGDSPIFGCGLYAGKAGAIAATGIGEEIVRRFLCYRVYERIEKGESTLEALKWGISLLKNVPVGLIAVTRQGGFGISNRNMAYSVVETYDVTAVMNFLNMLDISCEELEVTHWCQELSKRFGLSRMKASNIYLAYIAKKQKYKFLRRFRGVPDYIKNILLGRTRKYKEVIDYIRKHK